MGGSAENSGAAASSRSKMARAEAICDRGSRLDSGVDRDGWEKRQLKFSSDRPPVRCHKSFYGL